MGRPGWPISGAIRAPSSARSRATLRIGRSTRRLRPFWDGERITSLRTLAIGERVGEAGPNLFRLPMKVALMRDFRDAKAMARSVRDALKANAIETTRTEALELIAKAFGYENWNILSVKIEAAEPPASGERSPSTGAQNDPASPKTLLHVDSASVGFIAHLKLRKDARRLCRICPGRHGNMVRTLDWAFGSGCQRCRSPTHASGNPRRPT
jgi:hypothetical protein